MNFIPTLTELGIRLSDFGRTDASREVVAAACRENGWFQPSEVVQAVRAISAEFLDPVKLSRWLARYVSMAEAGSAERDGQPTQISMVASLPHPFRQSEKTPHVSLPISRSVLVVSAGNIPLVGFFDLLCVVSAGHRCLFKPSSKDTVLMRYVADILKDISPDIPIDFYDGTQRYDAVVATGSDNANRYFRSTYTGVPALLRANRYSIAVLDGTETPAMLAALSDDIFSYSGLGCRNVSMLFVPEGMTFDFPARTMNPKYQNNYRQRRAVLDICSQPLRDLGYALLVTQQIPPQALSEMSVFNYDDFQQVVDWVSQHLNELQCVVSNTTKQLPIAPVPFGTSQRPALDDYPDRVDVMAFLCSLG